MSENIISSDIQKHKGRSDLYTMQERCEYITSKGEKCKCVAIKGTKYCRWHKPKDIITPIENISTPSPSLENNNLQNTSDENDDLNFEIKLLKQYLLKLINDTPSRKTLDPKYLRLQLQLIEQIRKLVHSLSTIESQSKIYNVVLKIINSLIEKIVEVINKHTTDENLKNILSSELMALSKNENENNDLRILMKQLSPKRFSLTG